MSKATLARQAIITELESDANALGKLVRTARTFEDRKAMSAGVTALRAIANRHRALNESVKALRESSSPQAHRAAQRIDDGFASYPRLES